MAMKSQKEIVVPSILTKTNEKISLISALTSKKWLNKKNKGTLLCQIVPSLVSKVLLFF
jgi:hypothetical protein